jgi:hypothetical protein
VLATVGAGAVGVGGVAALRSPAGQKRIAIESVAEIPEEYGFDIDATVLEARITTDHTASVRITVENERDEARRISDGDRKLFSTLTSAEHGLLLLDREASPLRSPGCWRPVFGQSSSMALRIAEIPPEGKSAIDLRVWGESGVSLDDCLPTGTFRFDTTYHLLGAEGEQEFDWGFALSVDERKQ